MDANVVGLITGLFATVGFFGSVVTVVGMVVRSPNAKAKAEIMRAQALAAIEDKGALMASIRNEELMIQVEEQRKRIEYLEQELSFVRRLLPESGERERLKS